MINQLEFICRDCPLSKCNDQSLWCAYRWATNPNRQQKKMMRASQLEAHPTDRTQYYQQYYQRNRERILARAKERNDTRRYHPKNA